MLGKGGGHLKDVKRKLFMQEFTSHFTVKSAGSAALYPQNQLVSYINFSRGTFYLQTISCYRITDVGPNLVRWIVFPAFLVHCSFISTGDVHVTPSRLET